ncbi:NAD(P)H-dependent oxidoreductase [Phenylobacterium sp.]|uniref:FMN-dependent NADH-azoreductase n=1 Tax=Phenylobacterium sp. TaxID=1871053 RepID=UPI0011FE91D8|nr:NAD(P)H-dependent oxidoreductase [Phenylobacterium sp.]THD62568.1 MAG: FMN-dependent NADH-azoreductase [Phenylobacterium sp.]
MSLLVLKSSPTGPMSVSNTLVNEIVARHRELDPGVAVTERNLDAEPLPHLTAMNVDGVRAHAVTDTEIEAREVSDRLIAELFAADTLVIGAPMHNFSIPTTLRAWFDHVLRPRVTFGYSETGPKGLVTGKRAILALARGGPYVEGQPDHQESYLRELLAFIGVTEVDVVHAGGTAFGPEARAASIAEAQTAIASLVGRRLAA